MRRQWIIGLSIAAACSLILLVAARCGTSAEGTSLKGEPAGKEAVQNLIESQVLMIRPEAIATVERPPVIFDHARHVEALKDEGCQSCHQPDAEGRVSYEYAVWEGRPDALSMRDADHARCSKCHYEGATSGGKEVRALSCGECHVERAEYMPRWYPPTFDHFPHIDAMEKGCDTCHHQYDEQQKKLVYVKGREEACGKCHKDTPEGNRATLRKVGHTSCIGCHEKEFKAGNSKLDPYACRGCHRPEAKPRMPEPRELVARTYQTQPDQLLISYPGSILPPVPFDHQKHDPKNECSKCCHNFHVRTLVSTDMHFKDNASSCDDCHRKSEVSIRPGCLQADTIYHDKESLTSCIGCHVEKNKESAEKEKSPVTCKGCHKGGMEEPVKTAEAGPVDAEKGPETCIIARVSNKYVPVKFPHLQHAKMIPDCTSCHHHGPEKQEPGCYTCHGEPMDFMKLTKPRLISAYHRMCMGCHRNMGSGPVACTKCHEERETVYPSDGLLHTVRASDLRIRRQ